MHSCVHADSIARHHSAKLILLQYSSHGTNENSCRPRSGEGAARGQVLEAQKNASRRQSDGQPSILSCTFLIYLSLPPQTKRGYLHWRSTLSAVTES